MNKTLVEHLRTLPLEQVMAFLSVKLLKKSYLEVGKILKIGNGTVGHYVCIVNKKIILFAQENSVDISFFNHE